MRTVHVLRMTECQFGEVAVLELAGPIAGRTGAAMIDEVVRRHARTGTRIVVANLGGVPSIDLAGLGALVDACITMRKADGVLKLACISKRVHDLVAITRLFTVIDTFDSVDEAVRAPSPAGLGFREAAALSKLALEPIQRFLRRA